MATYTDPTTIISTGKPDPIQPGAVILVIGGIIALAVAGVFFFQATSVSSQDKDIQTKIAASQTELASLKSTATDLQTVSDQAKGLHAIFDTQKRWPAVLDKFAERLHKDMAVTSLQMSDKGAVSLTGIVPDYVTYAKVFQAFTDVDGQKYFAAVKPTTVTKVTDKTNNSYITFTFNLQLQPLVLDAGSLKDPSATN